MRVYVGERDPETAEVRVWVVEDRPRPELGEIAELLADLRNLSTASLFSDAAAEADRRAEVLARKDQLLRQIEAFADAPQPTELICRDGLRFGWGGESCGNALASSILRCETGEDATGAVVDAFREDVLDRRYDRWSLRLPSKEVWTWIERNRELVERELFDQPPADGASWAVTEDEQPAVESELSEVAASRVVRACEEAWRSIRERHRELPEVVMILGSGVERGRLVKLGHWAGGRWIADGELRGEVLLAGEALHLNPEDVFEVLLHEAAHGLNAARGIKDTSRGGRYHNSRFAGAAREVGLKAEAMPPYGLARTRLTAETREIYAGSIERLADVMRLARQIDSRIGEPTQLENGDGATDSERKQEGERPGRVAAECGCGRKMRIAKSVLRAGPITCGLCGAEFTSPGVERHVQQDAVVDRSFAERRRSELAGNAPDRHESHLQRDGLPTDDHEVVGRWYERFGSDTEEPMPAADDGERQQRVDLARALLRADGTLRGPDADIGPISVARGERVIMTADDDTSGVPAGTLGTVTDADPGGRAAEIDFATWGRIRIGVEDTVSRLLRYDYTEAAESVESDWSPPDMSIASDDCGLEP